MVLDVPRDQRSLLIEAHRRAQNDDVVVLRRRHRAGTRVADLDTVTVSSQPGRERIYDHGGMRLPGRVDHEDAPSMIRFALFDDAEPIVPCGHRRSTFGLEPRQLGLTGRSGPARLLLRRWLRRR